MCEKGHTKSNPPHVDEVERASLLPNDKSDVVAHQSRSRSRPLFMLSLLLFLGSLGNISHERTRAIIAQEPFTSFVKPYVIYGHVHMAKTAGSTINGNLSMHYERICGNKGYSYDSVQTNERFKKVNDLNHNADSYSKLYKDRNRGRVPVKLMEEIGYEDCDWISLEQGWQYWRKQFHNWTIPLELHVPCRSPIDHLMSQCNHQGVAFDCQKTETAMIQQIRRCLLFTNRRYNHQLEKIFPVKCFDFEKTGDYMEWIGRRLQRKRIETDGTRCRSMSEGIHPKPTK